jgi:hypothetical protein
MVQNQDAPALPPRPDPALKRLERFVGTWDMKGRTLGSEVDNVSGRITFEWLPGGFFLQQRHVGLHGPAHREPGAHRLRPRDEHLSLDRLLQPGADATPLPLVRTP